MSTQVAFCDSKAHKAKSEALSDAIVRELDQVDFHTNHYFSNNCYVREMHLPKGHVCVGKIHRYPCINIVSMGSARIVTDEGSFSVQAPCTFESSAGVNKILYALDDFIISTIHPWNGKDSEEEIEEKLIIPDVRCLEQEKLLRISEN